MLAPLIFGILILVALSWKWSLPIVQSALIIACSSLTALALNLPIRLWTEGSIPHLVAVVLVQVIVYLLILAVLFYRDPERAVLQTPDAVLSPADGKVIYIRRVATRCIPASQKGDAIVVPAELSESCLWNYELWQIGISMAFTDVHVNRAPVAGRVSLLRHQPGKFLSLRLNDAVDANERQTTVIENDAVQVGIVQIASRLVRRIETFVSLADTVTAGQRIGIIKFGSQVDLFVPVAQVPKLEVERGQRLRAGLSCIGLSGNRAESRLTRPESILS